MEGQQQANPSAWASVTHFGTLEWLRGACEAYYFLADKLVNNSDTCEEFCRLVDALFTKVKVINLYSAESKAQNTVPLADSEK